MLESERPTRIWSGEKKIPPEKMEALIDKIENSINYVVAPVMHKRSTSQNMPIWQHKRNSSAILSYVQCGYRRR